MCRPPLHDFSLKVGNANLCISEIGRGGIIAAADDGLDIFEEAGKVEQDGPERDDNSAMVCEGGDCDRVLKDD